MNNLKKLLELHEGREPRPYLDSVGKWTIGVGRNISDVPLSNDEIDFLLTNDINRVQDNFSNNFPAWKWFDEVRQLVIKDMIFNMGINRFLGFKKMIDCLHAHDFEGAAGEMMNSAWYVQTKSRAKRLHKMMLTGEPPDELK